MHLGINHSTGSNAIPAIPMYKKSISNTNTSGICEKIQKATHIPGKIPSIKSRPSSENLILHPRSKVNHEHETYTISRFLALLVQSWHQCTVKILLQYIFTHYQNIRERGAMNSAHARSHQSFLCFPRDHQTCHKFSEEKLFFSIWVRKL